MKKKLVIILSTFVLLITLVGLVRITLRIEGEVYLSCENTTTTFPFKKSISTRVFGIPSAKKTGEAKAESIMVSLENMIEGATAEYEIQNIKFVK
jgi:hypothetical protein